MLQRVRSNPFNAQTTIPYALPRAARVQLVVHNAAGQRVRTLANTHQQPGFYAAVWDGKDQRGRNAASGVYMVRLNVEGRTVHTRRMTLVR